MAVITWLLTGSLQRALLLRNKSLLAEAGRTSGRKLMERDCPVQFKGYLLYQHYAGLDINLNINK